jgi:hypothetical protein
MPLRRFTANEVRLDTAQAFDVLRFFFRANTSINISQITIEDRAFAQALLVEAVDASFHMGFIESIFTSAMSLSPSVKDIIKDLLRYAAQSWFRYATGQNMSDPKIYESVRVTLVRNFRTPWAMRTTTGEVSELSMAY